MKIGFKDWRECSQDLIPIHLEKEFIYYLHAQAWHLKGYIGGTHSYLTMWSKEHNEWIVIELTDLETLSYQNCKVIYDGGVSKREEHAAMISNRPFNAQWFGKNPKIIAWAPAPEYSDILKVAKEYPLKGFRLTSQNCNTFTSHVIYKLNLNLKRPLRSVGFRPRSWWEKFYATNI